MKHAHQETNIETLVRAMVHTMVRDEVAAQVREATRVDEYLSTSSAAHVADVTPGTVRRWVKAGRLTRHTAGRVVRVSRLELERLLKSGSAANEDLSPEELAAKRFG